MSGAFDIIPGNAGGGGGGTVDWNDIINKPSTFPSANHYHLQSVASDTWVITHGLGKYPSVFCLDSAGDEIEGSVAFTTINQVTVTFTSATGGEAFLN